MNSFDSKPNLSRRRLLAHSAKVSLLAGSLAAPAAWASALTAPTYGPERKLRLINAHTWEKLDVVYWSNGYYKHEALQQINYLMRDHRANKQIDIDKQLIDDLYDIYSLLETDERIMVLSGYRTPETNAKLRKRSSAVALKSLHMEGRAVDIQIRGYRAKTIRDAALKLGRGGVGYYATSGFVHLDTGEIRSWEQG
jgi:uncharacterized protein YcbK (DUF882 family)